MPPVQVQSAHEAAPAPVSSAAETQAAAPQPSLYRFEMPTDVHTPAPSVPVEDDDGPKMGNWQDTSTASPFDFSTPHASHPASVAAAATGAAIGAVAQSATSNTPFMPGFTATSGEDLNPQVKQGIGPELPRPNPVKLPTRRELASYGIKLPSQRMAEEKAKEQEQRQPEMTASDMASGQTVTPEEQDDAEQNQLREAFLAREQQRYGEEFAAEDEEALQQAALARQFAEQQQQRYTAEEPTSRPAFTLSLIHI